MIVSTSDFVGMYKISTTNFSELTNYINLFEPEYLRKVLGDENASTLEGLSPLPAKYEDLINGTTYTNTCDKVKINKGLKTALIAFIYFYYIRDYFSNTTTGNVVQSNENSEALPPGANAQVSASRYNSGSLIVKRDIKPFLTNYNTITELSTNSVENTGVYTVSIPDTTYLVTGDFIYIDGVKYTTTEVVADTSVKFTATSGLDFNNKNVIWYPFFQSNGNNIEVITI